MRIVFLGTPDCAVPVLEAVIGAGHCVPLVVTQPDRPAGRARQPLAPAVKRAAERHGLRVVQPAKVRNRAFREAVASAEPDLIVVVAYGRILPLKVLELPPYGAVNVHFSLLPKYRGAAPVQWALVRGERLTGVTTMAMNERMDEGDVLMQRELPVLEGEHAPALEERLARLGAPLLVETVAGLRAGTIRPTPQDHAVATLAPLLTRRDGEVDPGLTAPELEGRIRGFDPWPGVWLGRRGKRLRLVRARALGEPAAPGPAGLIERLHPQGVVLVCGSGTRLLLEAVQAEGRRVQPARDALNGRQIAVGDRLERLIAEG